MKIPRIVVFLGLTSLFTDMASEAIYPLLPIFLTQTLGASVAFVGILEGTAEFIASLARYFSGAWSDRLKHRAPLVAAGYIVSSIAKPLMSFVSSPAQVFLLRFTDRIGKGVRAAPRDAWLGEIARPEDRGQLFGFHRSMDHLGAVLGSLYAALFLLIWPGEYRSLFLSIFVPGILAVVCVSIALILERKSPIEHRAQDAELSAPLKPDLGLFSTELRAFLMIAFLFTLGNSADVFLILKLKKVGLADAWLPLAWVGLHIIRSGTSRLGGRLSDRWDRRKTIIAGWFLFAAVYLGFGMTESLPVALMLFFIYGFFTSLTEAPEKALITDLAPPHLRASAFGIFHLTQGMAALPASAMAGFLWDAFGPPATFAFGGAMAVIASLALLLNKVPGRVS